MYLKYPIKFYKRFPIKFTRTKRKKIKNERVICTCFIKVLKQFHIHVSCTY